MLGLSVTANVFDAECERLAEIVVDVAGSATVAATATPRHGAQRNGAARPGAHPKTSHEGRSRIGTVSRIAS